MLDSRCNGYTIYAEHNVWNPETPRELVRRIRHDGAKPHTRFQRFEALPYEARSYFASTVIVFTGFIK